MIVPHSLHSIQFLSFLAKRPWHLPSRSVATTRRAAMAASSASNRHGSIWIHRPFQITPAPSSSMPTISSCPLPKATPHSSPSEKLHHMYKSSHSPAQTLEQLYQSKVEFYRKQFTSRVPKEAWSRIDRRTIQSPRCLDKVDVTIYFPEDKEDDSPRNGICLHVHGGGLLWGDSHDQFAHRGLEMAQKLNAAVVSVEYSLFCRVNKNTNTFDPVNDVSIAIDWIETEGAAELNAKPSFVGSGESSGAHILLLAMLKHRDRGKANLYPPVPLQTTETSSTTQSNPLLSWKCLNLVYGMYDLSGTPSIQTDGDSSSPLCGNDLLWLYDLYTTTFQNDDLLSTKDASVSPLYANLSHLPPSLVSVGTADPLLDDSLFLANKYTSFGNHVELAIYEGGEHGIGHFGMQEDEEMGVRARENTLCFMKEYLQKK